MSNHQQYIDGIKYGQVNEIADDDIEPDEPTTDQSLDVLADAKWIEQCEPFLEMLHWISAARTAEGTAARFMILMSALNTGESLAEIAQAAGVTKAYTTQTAQDLHKTFGIIHSSLRRASVH